MKVVVVTFVVVSGYGGGCGIDDGLVWWWCIDGGVDVDSLRKGGSCNRYRNTIIVKVGGV